MQAEHLKEFKIVRQALNSNNSFSDRETESAMTLAERLESLKSRSSLFNGVELSDALKQRLAGSMAAVIS